MMKLLCLITLVASAFVSTIRLRAHILYADDFSSADLSGYNASPSAGTADNGAQLVDVQAPLPNSLSANAVRLYDLSSSAATSFTKDYSVIASTQLVQLFQFNVALSDDTSSAGVFSFRATNSGGNISSKYNCPFDVQLRMSNGTIYVYGATSAGYINKLNADGTLISVYTNSSTDTVVIENTVVGGTLTLEANHFAVYAGGALLGIFEYLTNSSFVPADGIGLFGFTSASTSNGGDILIDNIEVISIPETYALPAGIMEEALHLEAPYWQFRPAQRSHKLGETHALYALCLEAYLEQENGRTPYPRLVEIIHERFRSVIAGGNEPECQGGLGGWSHGPFAWSLAFARRTPQVWAAFSASDKTKADLLMEALAVAASFTLEDDNDYRVTAEGDRNSRKTWNPNHVEGYVGVALAAAWYFGVDELNARLVGFDFDPFVQDLSAAGFTNIVDCWTYTPATKVAFMQGGPFVGKDPTLDYGTGLGVRGNHFTYNGYELDQVWAIYLGLAERMFPHTAQTEHAVTGISGLYTHILETDAMGDFLISPYEGQGGMCMEFKSSNEVLNGSSFRSSLHYVFSGLMLNMTNAVGVWASGEWNASGSDISVLEAKMNVGMNDFFYKAEHGYLSFAMGESHEEDIFTVQETFSVWNFVSCWWACVSG